MVTIVFKAIHLDAMPRYLGRLSCCFVLCYVMVCYVMLCYVLKAARTGSGSPRAWRKASAGLTRYTRLYLKHFIINNEDNATNKVSSFSAFSHVRRNL